MTLQTWFILILLGLVVVLLIHVSQFQQTVDDLQESLREKASMESVQRALSIWSRVK